MRMRVYFVSGDGRLMTGITACERRVLSQLSFEVETIKPFDPSERLTIYPPGMQQEMVILGTERSFVAQAYGMMANAKMRVLGGPAWIDSDRYIISGKIGDDVFTKMQSLSNAEKQQQVNQMLRSLLAERFRLKVHTEMREMPVYELVVGKDGPKMDEARLIRLRRSDSVWGGSESMTFGGGNIRASGTLQDIFQMAPFGLEGSPIVNKTDLTGTYRITLKWNPPADVPGMPAAAQPAADAEPEASIFTVIQEQLGLKLVPAKGPVEVLVIDNHRAGRAEN